MKKVLGSVVVTLTAMLLVGCASKDASTNGFAKNQLEEMKKTNKTSSLEIMIQTKESVMKKLKMIGFVAAMTLISTTSVYAQDSKSDSFAKEQLEKMKEFKSIVSQNKDNK